MRRLVPLLALGLLLLSALPAHAARAPQAKLAIVSGTEKAMVDSGRVRVRVSFRRVGKVRLYARIARGGKSPLRLAVGKLVGFRRPGTKRVGLKLTKPAARLLRRRVASCAASRISVSGRARLYRLKKGRTLLAPINRSRRSRTTKRTKRMQAGCPRATPAPGGGGGRGSGSDGPVPGNPLRAGAASTDITPPVGTPMFAYTGRSGLANPPRGLQILADPDENLYAKSFEPSDGIHTRLRARTLMLEREGKRFALVQVDLGGVPYALVQEVLERIGGTGVSGERLMISATHTHSGTGPIWPADSTGYALLGGDIFDPRVFEITAEGIAESVRAAATRLEAARIGIGTAQLPGASRNRNFEPFRLNDDVPADEAGARSVSTDPELTALRIDATDGSPIGVWSNFAIHQTNFGDDNLLFSGDNAATAARQADREIGPGAVTVFTNSAEGDISPNGGADAPDGQPLQWVPTAASGANMAGKRLGDGIVSAWRDAGDNMTRDLPIDARRTFLLIDGTQADGKPVGPLTVLGLGGIVGPDGTCAPVDDLAGPGQGKKMLALGGAGLVPQTAPISMWRIGPLGVASYPLEITKQMGKRITDRLKQQAGASLGKVVIAGLTNGYQSYTATPEEYDACHYEGSFTLFGRHQGARFRDATLPLVGPLLSGLPAPGGAPEPLKPALGTPNTPSLEPTPEAGTATAQPSATTRHGRATFSWKGGNPAVDAPRGKTFVALQRETAPGQWQTVGTDDGESDTTAWNDADSTWTETWQFGTCDPLGSYRFRVTGMADKSGSGTGAPYELTSSPFALTAIDGLQAIDATASGGQARVRVQYPDPGQALLALPRRLRTGTATVRVNGEERTAALDAGRLAFTTPAPDGASVELVSAQDACGNSGP